MTLVKFHVDFSMDGAVSETFGVEHMFLCKITYIDILEPTDIHGNTISSERIRCRGIPTPCIKYQASQNKNNSFGYFDIYIYIYI